MDSRVAPDSGTLTLSRMSLPEEKSPKVSPAHVAKAELLKPSTKKTKGNKSAKKQPRKKLSSEALLAKYPRHAVDKVLRIPRAILDQNAGRDCSDQDVARFVGVGFGGPIRTEISSALKYGFLERPSAGRVRVTDLARQILRPQEPNDELAGLRKAVMHANDFSEVYSHYRGENLPDRQFFENALIDKFAIPKEKVSEFIELLLASLDAARLSEKLNDKIRLIDVSKDASTSEDVSSPALRKLSRDVKIGVGDTCFVMMPFGAPIGEYYSQIYEPAIRKAGLLPVRADNEIFGTGKIMDQIWAGITNAKVLVAELTKRNPNVFYELGLAHALKKPVVLVSSNEEDVPFDLKHIRVIYYNMADPFWGTKLLEKVAENILSALRNPEEAVFARAVETT